MLEKLFHWRMILQKGFAPSRRNAPRPSGRQAPSVRPVHRTLPPVPHPSAGRRSPTHRTLGRPMRDDAANRRLKVEAHDASRVEWSMYLPIPRGREVNEAEVALRLQFPENAYVPHDGWEQLQLLARLSSPDEENFAPDPVTVDGLRRSALGVARRLKLLRERVPRVAVAHALNPMPIAPSLARDLDRVLDDALSVLAQARSTLVAPQPGD